MDNTVLSNLAGVGRSGLLGRLWPSSCTTVAVLQEYEDGVRSVGLPPNVWTDLAVVSLTDTEVGFVNRLAQKLGAGERSCIAVAQQRRGLFVSDDYDAREVARAHNVAVTGTLGLLVGCVRRAIISTVEANDLLEQMIAAGYRSPVTTLDTLLDGL